ncbi:MAG: hypothetical protein P4L39_01510 [Humidesulfovibrio sp.]|nr:hypothetical protein [Humidesulfovibrio sp.]
MSLRVVFSVDVEEEGLFSGRYAPVAEGVSNVARLRRLEFVTREFGVPLTLLCTWPVLNDPGCRDILRRWREELGAEIAAHLHPWNTPPLSGAPGQAWTPSENMDTELLDAKLAELAHACRAATGEAPASFRMGRFDLGPKVRALLPRHGFRVDGSIVPVSWSPALPEAFLSPADPYLLPVAGGAAITEAPVTMVPLSPALRKAAWRLACGLGPGAGGWFLRRFHVLGAAGTLPTWFPLASMKLAVQLHLSRGGNVVHLFLHSSELMPGCAPHVSDEAAVSRVVARTRGLLHWLRRRAEPLGGMRGATMASLAVPPRPQGEARA